MTKPLMIFLALAAAFAITGGGAAAQERSWCLNETASDGGGIINCGFHTFAQCQVSRPGGSSHCVPNPALASSRPSSDSQAADRVGRR